MIQEINDKCKNLPVFSEINLDNILKDISALINECENVKIKLLTAEDYTWAGVVYPLDEAHDRLSKYFSPISHLNGVMNNPKIREIYQEAIQVITNYYTTLGQDENLFKLYNKILCEDKALTQSQVKSLEDNIRTFKLSGVNLSKERRDKFKNIVEQLAKLQSDFENNVLDSTMAWRYLVDIEDLKGLPDHVIASCREKAKLGGDVGYLLGLDMPTYISVMMFAEKREIRELMYKAFATRASKFDMTSNQWNNDVIMEKILELRAEKAKILGFDNYAEFSIETKMADNTNDVLDFLYDLISKSYIQAQDEYQTLKEFSISQGHIGELEVWDIAFYSEKLKKSLFDFTQEEMKDYFPETQVLSGLFQILGNIYNITAEEINNFDKYHNDVRLFSFKSITGEERGKIYLDLYARTNKRGGAWMDECRVRYKKHNGKVQNPVAYITCNFAKPLDNEISTLTHNDVVTLFHEFGHALHHILTKVDDLSISGINGVEWDAVELPSQFMENYCWSSESIKLISSNIDDNSPLTEALFNKLINSRKFQSGMSMVRQLEFAIFDFKLHMDSKITTSDDIQKLIDQVRNEISVKIPPSYNSFQNSFSHIFAGGYAAGYYSYKWAEVLSSDAFSKFEESGNILCSTIGKEFLTCILEKGGSRKAQDLFVAFRNRKASTKALLNHVGIST